MIGRDNTVAATSGRPPHKGLWNEDRLAVTLAFLSGYVDAYGFVHYKIYVSFMSGNTTQASLLASGGHLPSAVPIVLAIVAFVAGAFAGAWLLHSQLRSPRRWLLLAVAALFATNAIAPSALWTGAALLSFAMGALTTSVTRVGAQSVTVGYITGSLSNMAQHLALAAKRLPVPDAEGPWDTHFRRVALLASIWFALIAGAVLAGVVTSPHSSVALLPAILLLVVLAACIR